MQAKTLMRSPPGASATPAEASGFTGFSVAVPKVPRKRLAIPPEFHQPGYNRPANRANGGGLFKDHRNAGGEPDPADISDQEYRAVAVERGSRRKDIVDREIAVSLQWYGIGDWRAKEGSSTNQGREDALPTIRPNLIAAGKK